MAVADAEIEAGSADENSTRVDIGNASITQVSETSLAIEPNGMTRSQAFNLYTSHILSTWNVRQYEFAAVSAGWGA
jgi:solute carrier family 40 (iron-regulated transporter), member 1